MSDILETPIKILTLYRQVTQDSWPGETPVELFYADDRSDLAAMLPGMDVLVAQVFTEEMGIMANRLKLIQCAGAGYENIDFEAVPKDCVVANVYEHEKPIAEWVIMAMIALDRELFKADRTLRAGSWEMSHWHHSFYPELESRTLGIIGLGRIGRRTAELAKVFGMRIIAATRTVPPEADARSLGIDAILGMDGLDRVLQEADFLLLSLPLTTSTQGIINERALALMKPTVSLINVARAEVVDEQALFAALKAKRIKGAALDVWYHEPTGPKDSPRPASQPFWELDNVIMSPHVSGITTGLLRRRLNFVAKNIDRLARGEPVQNIISNIRLNWSRRGWCRLYDGGRN